MENSVNTPNSSAFFALFKQELNNIYDSKIAGIPLQKNPQEEVNLDDLKETLADLPREKLLLPDLTFDDLPRGFSLQNLTGQQITFAYLPITITGRPIQNLAADDLAFYIDRQNFYKVLFSDPQKQNLTQGFTEDSGYFFDLLPLELKKDLSQGGCTFLIDKTFQDNTEAKIWYLEKINQARHNLTKILSV